MWYGTFFHLSMNWVGKNWKPTRIRNFFVNVFSHSSTRKPTINSNQRKEDKSKDKPVNISRIPLFISPRLNKFVLEKSKFYKEDQMLKPRLYTQVLKKNINKFIKIKDIFSKLSFNKILKIHKVINNLDNKEKSKLNMITKDHSCK